MKVPAARLENMIEYISPSAASIMPRAIPSGVAAEKIVISHRTSLKSFGNDFTSEIPKELAAADL